MSSDRRAREQTSAGGVVFRRSGAQVEVLLGDQTDWRTRLPTTRLPKGHVEEGETLEQTAVREVLEETGHRAVVREHLEELRYSFDIRDGTTEVVVQKRVVLFLMEATDTAAASAHDDEMERVYWCEISEAAERLSFEPERRVVERAALRLGVERAALRLGAERAALRLGADDPGNGEP